MRFPRRWPSICWNRSSLSATKTFCKREEGAINLEAFPITSYLWCCDLMIHHHIAEDSSLLSCKLLEGSILCLVHGSGALLALVRTRVQVTDGKMLDHVLVLQSSRRLIRMPGCLSLVFQRDCLPKSRAC